MTGKASKNGHQETSTRILSVDEILNAPDLEEQVINVSSWGGAIRIRSLTKAATQAIRREARSGGDLDLDRVEMMMLLHSVVDPPISEEHYEALRGRSSAAIEYVLGKIMALNGQTKEAMSVADRMFPR